MSSLPGGTKMFQFPPFASPAPCGECRLPPAGCPIRIPAGHRPFAPLRGFSQLVASFFASVSQGIHLAPFFLSSYSFLSAPLPPKRIRGYGSSYFQLLCRTLAPSRGARPAHLVSLSLLSSTKEVSLFLSSTVSCVNKSKNSRPANGGAIVENNGFEPLTPCLQGRCSSQLS